MSESFQTTADLVREIKITADKLLRDNAPRGDVKLLSTALKELRYCFKVFGTFREHRKVTIFGSARTPTNDRCYQQAVQFGKQISNEGFMVITGAASGIMEAGHVGAGREKSFGVNILLPFEQAANKVITGDIKLMHLKYFFTRKLIFIKQSDAVVLFPGGFGTLDEGFEVLTLIQTGKSHMMPVVLLDEPGGDYWQKFREFIEGVLLPRGFISAPDPGLYRATDSVEEAVQEVVRFYRVYHSQRYVKGELVLRLQRAIGNRTLEKIQSEYKDILREGTFVLAEAVPGEENEPDLTHLPRLRFRFNRKDLGRLRLLIDDLNADE
jgi:hypothetical protein